MNIRNHIPKILAGGLALAVAVPTIAMAAHPFTDVEDGQWYTDAVHWAYDNELTTGKTPTTFAGFDETNRYEVVTFFNRYHDNMVAPELSDIRGDVRDTVEMQFAMLDSDGFGGAAITTSSTAPDEVPVSAEVTIPEGYKGVINVELTGESACHDAVGYCRVHLYVDGEEITPGTGQAFDSSDAGTEGGTSYETHAISATSDELEAGTYSILVGYSVNVGSLDFRLDDVHLTAQVHLTDTADLGFVTLGD